MVEEKDDNIILVEETYNEIGYLFSPMLSEESGSRKEIEAVDEFLSLIRDKDNSIIADLGCGVGKHGRYCAKKGYRVTGLDISKIMIELADNYNNMEGYAKIDLLKIADMCDFYTDEIYDGVISLYSFIHLTYEQAIKALNNLKRYLKKGAYVAISVYKGDRNGIYPEILQGKHKHDLKTFIRDYQMDEFKKLFNDTGYSVVRTSEWSDTDDLTAACEEWDSGVLYIIAQYGGCVDEI